MLMKFHVICLNNIFNDIFNTDCFFLIKICLLLYCTREGRLKTSYLIFRRPFDFFQFKPIKRFYFFIASVKALTL